jgi:DNA-binding NarL/FixJ family response regulator
MRPVQILLADDHEVVRKGLRALLEAQPGWKVIAEAMDGREAVEKAKDMHPSVDSASRQSRRSRLCAQIGCG